MSGNLSDKICFYSSLLVLFKNVLRSGVQNYKVVSDIDSLSSAEAVRAHFDMNNKEALANFKYFIYFIIRKGKKHKHWPLRIITKYDTDSQSH